MVDDFVVRRNDGAFAYNLAVVVDDAEQGVGEVVRGADLLRLDAAPAVARRAARASRRPRYAHVPLMLGPDGERLAKRHGAVTLADRAALGAVPGGRPRRAGRRRSGWASPASGPPWTARRPLLVRRAPPGAGMRAVRTWLPVGICVAGVVLAVVRPDETGLEGGACSSAPACRSGC